MKVLIDDHYEELWIVYVLAMWQIAKGDRDGTPDADE